MEEHIWYLVEKFISGAASEWELGELEYLLGTNPEIFSTVKEFLETYRDPEPLVTTKDIETLLKNSHLINSQLSFLSGSNSHIPAGNIIGVESKFFPPVERKSPGIFAGFIKELSMCRQFFKTAVRNIQHNKGLSFINISGLAIGIASAALMLLWIQNQLSYDQFHKNKDRVYQVFNRASINGELRAWDGTPQVLGPVLKTEYPQVEEMTRINWVGAFVLKTRQKRIETQGFLTDPGFFKLFSFPLLKGNAATALSGAHSIVLTQKLATKLFGNADPMGKTIKVDSTAAFTVTAVLKDLPGNTMFNFEYLMPWSYMKEVGWDNSKWDFYSVRTFVLLKPGISEPMANKYFRNIYRLHNGDARNDIIVHPMGKWWLYSKFENGKFTDGQIVVVRLFGIIAVLIMLIACINYMNIGTARSTRRAREVGIRKVAGAGKGWLIKQFLGESLLISALAGILAIIIVQLTLSLFNELIESRLTLPFDNLFFWLGGIGFVLFTGIVAGSYPAFYLSSFKPAHILRGAFKGVNTLITPRKILVVIQFTFAILFIICTAIIYRQINFAQSRDTGYNRDNLVYIYMKGDIQKNFPSISNELISSGAVSSVTRTNSPVIDIWNNDDTYQWPGKDPKCRMAFAQYLTDKNFIRTTGLPLLAGRDINIDVYPADSAAILLSASAVKAMGLKNPVGQNVKSGEGTFHIVGVVKDFVAGWPYELSQPMVIRGAKRLFGTINLKLNDKGSVADNIKRISNIFKKYNPDYPFDYKFVGETYSIRFQNEKHTGLLAAVFAGLTIFISCMGLFALAACMAESRVKEIGIRKVLGASVIRIASLLSKDFLILVVISFGIASPAAWVMMKKWLQTFPYHVQISWWVFIFTGLISIIIALLTISYQALKAAFANPVKSLRSE
ncbi:MAG: ABC transporter permease [Mucilaginibacter sp.]